MTPDARRPVVALLTSHWLSMLGVALATTAGFSWLFVLPRHLRGGVDNPYIGILIFLVIPALLILGLALIPIGIFLARRRVVATVLDKRAAWRRLGSFLGLMTFVNLVIGSQATYRAVVHMETDQFCGQSCHVMKPEFTAWRQAAHSHVECVECHIGPGASGWFAAKAAGIRQLSLVTFDNFRRPIESAIESNRLVGSMETCERCHARTREIGMPIRIISSFKDDETNTRSETVLTMRIGGPTNGIHGAHMGPGVRIQYAAADAKRQTIPWVRRQLGNAPAETFVAADAKPGSIAALPKYYLQCSDCHNRPAHSFEAPGRAVDKALEAGELPVGLPFIKKTAVELLTANYATDTAAAKAIPDGLDSFYKSKYPDVYGKRKADIAAAGQTVLAIFSRNVFPDLKVTWGTYPNNMGHTDFPGCFRCHDDSHVSASKKTIPNDCSLCHETVAVDEASPDVLKTLGIADRLSSLQKQ